MNILTSYWFISQLASILLRYWSPVSPAEFNCFTAASPPSFPFLLSVLHFSLSSWLSTLSSVCPFFSFLFSSRFLSYPTGRHYLLNKFPYVISRVQRGSVEISLHLRPSPRRNIGNQNVLARCQPSSLKQMAFDIGKIPEVGLQIVCIRD